MTCDTQPVKLPCWILHWLAHPLYAPQAKRWLELRARVERGDMPPPPETWAGRPPELWARWVREVLADDGTHERHLHVYDLQGASPHICERCGMPYLNIQPSDLCELLGHFWDAPWYPHGCQRCQIPKTQEATA